MINKLIRLSAACASAAIVMLVASAPALSQQPTDAQRSAIRSDCRSDYEAHCASVPPGGMASLQCLQKNMSSLSPSCQRAVSAVEPPAAAPAKPAAATAAPATTAPASPKPAAAAAPATVAPAPAKPTAAAAPAAATGAAAKKPTNAQVAAIRSACRADYQKSCASTPPGGAAALGCLEKNKATLSPSCQQAVNATSGGTAAAAGAPAATATAAPGAAPAAAAAPALVLRPLRPREEVFVVRSACGGDVRALCGTISPGGGRIAMCLAAQAASLSPACREVLSQFAAR